MMNQQSHLKRPVLFLGALLSLAALAPTSAQAASRTGKPTSAPNSRPFGLGIFIGEPTGLTGKYWLDGRSAVDTTFSFSFDNYFLLYADYLYHWPGVLGPSNEFLSRVFPYAGVGGMLLIQTKDTGNNSRHYFRSDQGSSGFGVRIPLGLEWRPVDPTLGVFVEVTPGVGVIPATYGFIQGGVGIRFYF